MPKTIIILGPPGTGKCVDPNTYILTSGGIIKIGALVSELPGPDKAIPLKNVQVQGFNGLRDARIFYDGGIKPTVGISTKKGFEVIGTENHPVLGMRDGELAWIRLGAIIKGDRIAIQCGASLFPKTNPELPPSNEYTVSGWWKTIKYNQSIKIPEYMNEELAEWLGWFIGEGCFNTARENQGIGFCNFSKSVIERMESLTKRLFDAKLYIASPHNYRIGSLRLKRWLRDLGADGLSADKKIPTSVLCSTENCQRAFIRAIFEAEASVCVLKRGIEFTTTSRELCCQLQMMLVNFGIVANKGTRQAETKRWGLRTYWRLSFYGNDLITFRNKLGFMVGSEKQKKLESIKRADKGWSLNGIPTKFVSKRFLALRREMRSSKDRRSREYWYKIKAALRALSGSRKGQQLVSRDLVRRLLSDLLPYGFDPNYEDLEREVDSDRFWDVVETQEKAGDRQVVDLTVPEGQSFIGNGFLCHNTSSAITVTQGWFERGAGPDEVAYLAFTRAAAREAAKRITKGSLPEEWSEKLPYFRTIHSLAYRGLRKAHKDLRVITTPDMKSFAQWSSFDGTFSVGQFEDLSEVYQGLERHGRTEWDDCLTAYTLARIVARTAEEMEAAKFTLPQAALQSLGFIEEEVYKAFVNSYEQFKTANGLVDFTDMLKFALTEMEPLEGVNYLVVDELQDNAPILFSICDRLFPNAEAWLCGDPNQSIYRFAGADPGLFMERARKADHRIVLRRTHRFGQEIVEFSKQIIGRALDGVIVDLKGAAGRNHRIHMSGQFQPTVAEMLILHRHVMGCQALGQAYIMAGMPFRCERGRDPLGAEMRILGFNTLNDLANGQPVAAGAISRLVDELMPSVLPTVMGHSHTTRLVVHGAKKRLQEGYIKGDVSLNELTKAKILTEQGVDTIRRRDYRVFRHADDLEYYARVVNNGYSLNGTQIPTITTIHGSKGRQAPRVVVFSEMGMRCFDDQDSEHRLAYVASTRTQGDLEICAERTVDWAEGRYHYPVPKEAPRVRTE